MQSAGHCRVHVDLWASERYDMHVTFHVLARDIAKRYDHHYYVMTVRRRIYKGGN